MAGFFMLVMIRSGVDYALRASPFLLVICLPFLAVYLGVLWIYFARVELHFGDGCLCPAVVLSVQPYRIAVYTDLTMGGPSRHAIKVLRAPLGRMTGGPPAVGQKLATIAMYWRRTTRGYYGNFDPRVVNCATRDEAKIQHALARIPDADWQALYAGLKQLGNQPRPGLYHIDFKREPVRVAGAGDPQLVLVGVFFLVALLICGGLLGAPSAFRGLAERADRERPGRDAKVVREVEGRPGEQGGDRRIEKEGPPVQLPPIDADDPDQAKVYLSDLREMNPRVGYGNFGKNGWLGYGIGGAADSPITVAGRKFPKAISTAPPHFGASTVQYPLNQQFKTFRAWIAVNDLDDAPAAGPESPLTFELLGDGKRLWASEPVRLTRTVQECRVSVAHVQTLELRVNCPGVMHCARAVWLQPYLLK
jgi:hypothetical protein